MSDVGWFCLPTFDFPNPDTKCVIEIPNTYSLKPNP